MKDPLHLEETLTLHLEEKDKYRFIQQLSAEPPIGLRQRKSTMTQNKHSCFLIVGCQRLYRFKVQAKLPAFNQVRAKEPMESKIHQANFHNAANYELPTTIGGSHSFPQCSCYLQLLHHPRDWLSSLHRLCPAFLINQLCHSN